MLIFVCLKYCGIFKYFYLVFFYVYNRNSVRNLIVNIIFLEKLLNILLFEKFRFFYLFLMFFVFFG